ncbi:MAG: HAD family phosphatase [Clostridia bacterium]|nr:HAD family phosphatase [Clostridia bacterium]
MGIFDGVLICSDWDGSLSRGSAYPGQEVCPENREAIRYFQQNGGLFTVSSGRYPSFILAFREQFFPNTALIALNGSLIVDPESGEPLREQILDPSVFPYIDRVLDAFPYQANLLHYPVGASHATTYSREEYRKKKDAVAGAPCYKALLVTDTAEHGVLLRDTAREIIAGTQFEAARSWPIGLEFINRASNKGSAVRFLKEKTGAELLVTVGDYENDIPMLEAADVGYAVANATDDVKRAADRVTHRSNAEGAVAEIIEDIEKIRRS